MRARRLAGTEIETSALGLGCAGLFEEAEAAGRRAAIETALDAGIRHFDVAPMYGLGLAERELGRALGPRRRDVVIATKFGIVPTRVGRALRPVQARLRHLAARASGPPRQQAPAITDARAGPVGGLLYGAPGYDAAAARASLERSLRELGTDYVDVLFLHDPRPGDIRSDDVRAYLETARDAGLVRAWGAAGEPAAVAASAERLGALPVRQIRHDVLAPVRDLDTGQAEATIIFGVLRRALPLILAHVRADEETRRRWNDAVGADCGDPDVVSSLLLHDALRATDGGPVLFGSSRPARIAAAAAAVEEPPDAVDVSALARLAATELGGSETRA